jgi:hypothetical protein
MISPNGVPNHWLHVHCGGHPASIDQTAGGSHWREKVTGRKRPLRGGQGKGEEDKGNERRQGKREEARETRGGKGNERRQGKGRTKPRKLGQYTGGDRDSEVSHIL